VIVAFIGTAGGFPTYRKMYFAPSANVEVVGRVERLRVLVLVVADRDVER
jgi:hypothetical protein